MDKKYIRYGIYVLIIFISIVIIGNISVFKYNDSRVNSMNFDELEKISYKQDPSIEEVIKMLLTDEVNKLKDLKYDSTYNMLTEECKSKKFTNNIDNFKKDISEKYVNVNTYFYIEYACYYKDTNAYVFKLNLSGPPYLTEDLAKLEVYQTKTIYIAVYADENNNYTIDWDF